MSQSLAYELRGVDPQSDESLQLKRDATLVAFALAGAVAVPVAVGIFAWVGNGESLLVGLVILGSSLLTAAVTAAPIGGTLAAGAMPRWALLFAGPPLGGLVGGLMAIAVGFRGLSGVAVGWSLGCAAIAVALSSRQPIRRARSTGTFRAQIRFTALVSGAAIISTLALRVDVLALGAVSTTREVGLYTVAIGASELVWFAPAAVALAWYGRVGAAGRLEARHLTEKLIAISLALSAFEALVLFVFADPLFRLVFGDAYGASADYLRIMLIGIVLFSPVQAIANYFTNHRGMPSASLVISGTTLLVSATAATLGSVRWGGTGAAVGSTIGYAVGAGVALFLFARERPPAVREGSSAAGAPDPKPRRAETEGGH